ncbi:MAG TPA: hypothetical protein VG273_13535 [Bryobacteraceae bacterium]|jgi:DUF4097 and DUF4098 domain-containing protein YvlB|nr:hypothetical protein [Bryobacteraceae bacterium]
MYYEKIAMVIGACALAAAVSGASHRNWNMEAREALNHVFTGDKTLNVDNVNGLIQVIGDGGTTIRIEGEKIIRAADQQQLDRAKREVVLDINEKNGIAQLYVNGPFRENSHASDNHGFHENNDREYEVTYNFTIHVPRQTDLELRSVNGEVKTEQTNGKFNVHGVNGGVTMTSIAGSGELRTVNGPIVVSFRESPKAAASFNTVNGRIDATFPASLSADMSFKTLNGETYTDFDVTSLASPPGTAEKKDGRFVYRRNRITSVRAGSGGPQLSFETVNGQIRIQKAH